MMDRNPFLEPEFRIKPITGSLMTRYRQHVLKREYPLLGLWVVQGPSAAHDTLHTSLESACAAIDVEYAFPHDQGCHFPAPTEFIHCDTQDQMVRALACFWPA